MVVLLFGVALATASQAGHFRKATLPHMHLLGAGVAISLEQGKLVAITKGVLTDREQLDQLMKAAYTAATSLYPQAPAAPPLVPYR